MVKAKIALNALKIIRGSEKTCTDGCCFLPDETGFVSVKLENLDWTDDSYLILDLYADMDEQAIVDLRFFKKNASPHENPAVFNFRLIPMRRIKVAVKLDELSSRRLFLRPMGGMLKGHVMCDPCSISEMGSFEILLHPGWGPGCRSFTLYDVSLATELPDMTVSGDPMVDKLGQWKQKDWNTKTHSEEEMISYLKAEYDRAVKEGAKYPEGWSKYGGWLKKQFKATGFFYPLKDNGRWWLVDPEGYAFISNGLLYGSRMGVFALVDKNENLFEWLPAKDDQKWKAAWTNAGELSEYAKRHGKEDGKKRPLFNFARANMIRAFGPDKWWDAWVTIASFRIKRWGFNTFVLSVNNYVDERVHEYLKKAEIPFICAFREFPQTKYAIFRDFPDVFSDEYAEESAHFAEKQLGPYIKNPWMIGYFPTNEPEWRFQALTNVAERVFAHPENLASKEALIARLEEKYGDISALNASWKRNFDSFADLKTPIQGLDTSSPEAATDFKWLKEILISKYYEVPCKALKKVDPEHLNLGFRFNCYNSEFLMTNDEIIASKWFDVFSFNCYDNSAREKLEIIEKNVDMPVMLTEWHIAGGGDKGFFNWGIIASHNQEDRSKAAVYYLENAVAQRCCVGLHYSEYNDQPVLGRYDGDNQQIGLIDVCNRVYEECTSSISSSTAKLYSIADGTVKPTEISAPAKRER